MHKGTIMRWSGPGEWLQFLEKGGCNHIKAARKPNFGMNVEDIKKPSRDVFHVARRFFTLIWDKGGSQVVAAKVEAYMKKVWLLEFMPSCCPLSFVFAC